MCFTTLKKVQLVFRTNVFPYGKKTVYFKLAKSNKTYTRKDKKTSPCNAEPDWTLGLNTTVVNTENIHHKCATG